MNTNGYSNQVHLLESVRKSAINNATLKEYSVNIKYLLIISLFSILVGCSGDPHKAYSGLWERTDIDEHVVMSITNTDGTFLFLDNILNAKTFSGKEKKPAVLELLDEKLVFNNGFQKIALILSDDQKTLWFLDQTYIRIDESRLNEIKNEVEQEKLQREKELAERKINKEKCDKLRNDFQSKKLKLAQEHNAKGFKYTGKQENYQKLQDTISKLKSQYEIKQKSIPKCNAVSVW